MDQHYCGEFERHQNLRVLTIRDPSGDLRAVNTIHEINPVRNVSHFPKDIFILTKLLNVWEFSLLLFDKSRVATKL